VASTSAQASSPRGGLLRHPQFVRLWSAATISLFGTQVSQIAIPFIAAVVLNAEPGLVGLLTTVEFLPFILFTLPAGVWVDRLPRRPILVVGDLGRAVMLASIPIAYAFNALTIWQLYVVGFVNGVLTVFFDVADQSYLPEILEKDQLTEGNAKLQISMSSAQILGQPFAGGAVAVLTAPVAVLVDAVSFVASAGLILSIREKAGQAIDAVRSRGRRQALNEAAEVAPSPSAAASVLAESAVADADPTAEDDSPTSAATRSAEPEASMRQQMTEGLRFIGGQRFLRSIAASTATSNLFGNIMFAIFPVYVYRVLELAPEEVGTIGGVAGIGVLLGALLAVRAGTRLGIGRAIVGALLVAQVAIFLVAGAPQGAAFWFVAAGLFLTGFGGVVYNVNQVSLRQAITPNHFLGRMNATMRFLVWGTIPLGSLIGAGLSQLIGVHETVWVGALLSPLAVLPVLFSPVRGLAEIPKDEDAVPA
jgi:MFS family permease